MRSSTAIASLAFLLILGMPCGANHAFAQQAATADQRIYEVTTRDGVRYYGYLQVETPERVVIRTPGGAIIELARADIASMVEAEGTLVGQDFRRADPNPTRLFFGPTGRSLKKGEAYFGVYEVIMPFVQVGLTDRLSIGGGTPLFLGEGNHPFWVTPKFQVYRSPRTSISVGAMHFLNVDGVTLGIAYAAGTFGSADNAVTLGVGRAYYNNDDDDAGSTVALVGGERRLSRRLKLITENYVLTGGAVLSAGIRLLGESLSADIGLIAPFDTSDFIAFPIVNFVWKF